MDNALEFHNPEKIQTHNYHGPMYGHETSRLNYLVSEGHNLWAKKYYKSDANYEFIPISDGFGKKLKHTLTINPYKGKDIKTFSLPGTNVVIDINIWAEFVGWFLSEGCVNHYRDGHTSVCLTQVKEINPKN